MRITNEVLHAMLKQAAVIMNEFPL